MEEKRMLNYIKEVLEHIPEDWLNLTTHRLDIYDEESAKFEFLEQFEKLFKSDNSEATALNDLPTAYDYIRLGHPLSCILEWLVAKLNNRKPEQVLSFSSKTIPIMAVLRKNALLNRNSQIVYIGDLPDCFDVDTLKSIYGYKFELKKIAAVSDLEGHAFDGSTIFVSHQDEMSAIDLPSAIDFYVGIHSLLGSILIVNGEQNEAYISSIQHVRRRETIAMTPSNSRDALKLLVDKSLVHTVKSNVEEDKKKVEAAIKEITNTNSKIIVGSSGLSVQYAVMMGLIHDARENHKGKEIKIVVPPNCYGGTNDQARRVAESIDHVEVVDLLVDGEHEMVQSIDDILNEIASADAIAFIIAEIPTNPRVEVPDLIKLKETLSAVRKTAKGEIAVDPVFILDQTFCPNVHFLAEGEILSTVRTISYVSGSKFPSGGQCTAGYCVGNSKTDALMEKIEQHMILCDNRARNLQMEILAKQMPSMNQRIKDAHINARGFVDFISSTLPETKINFVTEELANQGFTTSVFSMDLPTKGDSDEEREAYKRELNLKLIQMMITEIPHESKHCVSYGQLKGCYWTIPATSTQGTTKEGDKDYIARVSCSPDMDLELHKKVFLKFVESI